MATSVRGLSYAEIGELLFMSEQSVCRYVGGLSLILTNTSTDHT